MKNLFLILTALLLLGTAAVGAEEKAPTPKNTKTVHMKIEGMTCSVCSAAIQKRLAPLCAAASVDHETGHGECTYQTGKTSQETIVRAVEEAGFKVVETH